MEKLSNDFSKCHFLPANDWKIVDYNLNKQTSIYLQKIERVSGQNKTLGTLIGNQHHETKYNKMPNRFWNSSIFVKACCRLYERKVNQNYQWCLRSVLSNDTPSLAIDWHEDVKCRELLKLLKYEAKSNTYNLI